MRALVLALAAALGATAAPVAAPVAEARGAAREAAWRLDPTFGDGGIVRDRFRGGEPISGGVVAVQPDGKILWGGKHHGEVLLRYHADGTLDRTFGDRGVVVLPSPWWVGSIVLQPVGDQDKILVSSGRAGGSLVVFRLNEDGSLDSAEDADPDVEFGEGGTARVTFVEQMATSNAADDRLAVAPDGRIAWVGDVYPSGRPAVVLLTADGDADGSFDADGIRLLPYDGTLTGVEVVPEDDGFDVVAAGKVVVGPGGRQQWITVRVHADGSDDEDFGDGGAVLVSATDRPCRKLPGSHLDVGSAPPGHVVLVGTTCERTPTGPAEREVVVRLQPGGGPDPTFSDDGIAVLPVAPPRHEVAKAVVDEQGRTYWVDVRGRAEARRGFHVGGLDVDGAPDERFGPDGRMEVRVHRSAGSRWTIAVDGLGRLVVGGSTGSLAPEVDRVALARLTDAATPGVWGSARPDLGTVPRPST